MVTPFVPNPAVINQGTAIDKPFEDPEAAECRAKGGTWDALTRTCKLPEAPKTPTQVQEEADVAIAAAGTPKEQAPAAETGRDITFNPNKWVFPHFMPPLQ